MTKKTFSKTAFLFLIAMLGFAGMNAQTFPLFPCGTGTTPSTQSSPTNCLHTSTTYTSKYALPQTYIPTTSDPVITLKLTLHIFTDGAGNGIWANTSSTVNGLPALNSMLSLVTNGNTERFSEQRTATYASTFTPTFINDSRIQYEVTNIYFYPSATLYTATSTSSLYSHINTTYPGRLEEGMPILINNGGFYGHLSSWNNAPAFATTYASPDTGFYRNHFRHEIAHCFGLGHVYANNGDDWSTFGAPCGTDDYLSDVFPSGMTNCPYETSVTPVPNPPTNPPCNSCFEFGDPVNFNNLSYNILGGQGPNKWMSPIQMGRRYRMMHLTYIYPFNLRVHAKDMVSQHTNPWLITSNETWDFDMQTYKDIIVKAGNTLTVKCKIAMAIDGKIKVEKGAKLLIDGGEITGWCKTGLWKGIEVEGDATQNQNYSGGYALYQGICESVNSSTISNAQNAICTYTTNTSGVMDANSTGGIVIGNTTNFINNVRSVEFYYYYSPNGGNKSMFTKCNFNTASLIPTGALPSHHVTLYNVDGVRFLGCNFEYAAGSAYNPGDKGNGIYSIDAQYSVDHVCNNTSTPCSGGFTKTEFKNLENGIYADNTNVLRVVSVMNCNFYDIENKSTYFNSINTPVFTDNYVRTVGTGLGVGLYLNNCKYYNAKNNTFIGNTSNGTKQDVGIYVKNSQTGVHKIYRNSFANFAIGIGAINDNSGISNNTDGLKMNCNDFTPTANGYDITLLSASSGTPTVMKTQGAVTGMSSGNLVRNIYGAASTCGGCENQWYIHSTSTKTVDHGSNSNSNTRPTPQPDNSDVAVNVVNSGIALTYSLDCPATETVSGGGGGARLVNLNNYIRSLSANNDGTNAKGTNPTETKPAFEIQAAVAEKLNYFLLDTLPESKDSVIALLQNNPGGMDDADVQLTYAYINKGDFISAQQNINALAITKPDWAALQLKLLAVHLSPQKAASLKTNAAVKSFLENFAVVEDKSGRGAAQAMLKFAYDQNYFIPQPVPVVENGINKSINNPLAETEIGLTNSDFKVFPNPAAGLVNIVYKGNDETIIHISLTDPLGNKVYVADIKGNSTTRISLDNFVAGVYLFSAYNGKTKVYQTKVICIK